jgi:predicted unusual protein kinase regulating ubiquinone biosynthesis (AarF/ABC1/UbiB family)
MQGHGQAFAQVAFQMLAKKTVPSPDLACHACLCAYFHYMTKPPIARAVAVPARRVSRLGRLGAMAAGVAGNMALGGIAQLGQGHRPNMRDLLLTPRNFNNIANQLAHMRGAAMKIGQLMSMDTGDVLPPEIAQIMARLRDNAHIMPPAQLKKVLNTQWPTGWLSQFAKFDVHPIAAASIGQVHRAHLKTGEDLAIKVQYPGVAQSIDSDVANVGALIRMSGLLPKGFDLAPYLEEGRAQLHDETDYLREADNLALFGRLLADDPGFLVPLNIPEWSTPQILAMTHVTGLPIEDAVTQPQHIRDQIAHALIDLTLREMFQFGVMQTDPNFANYLYDPAAARVVLLDFGATRVIAPTVIDQYRRLITAGLNRDTAAVTDISLEIGFIAPDTPATHSTHIVQMIQLVMDTLCNQRPLAFAETQLSHQMQAHGLALADDGFVPPPLPIDVVLLQRKFGGMFLLARRLQARVDVVALLHHSLEQC